MNNLEAQALHGAIETALKATERAAKMAREKAPMGITPLVLEAADTLAEATMLAGRAVADSTQIQL